MNNKDDGAGFLSFKNLNVTHSISNREAAPCISASEMDIGRDEMNLVEFPLAGLANRPPCGKETLVFEDSVWDKQQRASVRKRLTVAASAEFGLPTALDDEVILGLVQLANAGQFVDRKIAFVPADLFRLLGWREEGRSYSRLETSLKRWLGITLYYDRAWWDKQRQAWVDEHFHLLENVVVRRGSKRALDQRKSQRRPPWSVTWNEVVFRSFQAGYLKKLDMSLYRELRLAAAKRMYRFLDKRFYFTNRLTFDLRTFACEHIGFGRGDDNSQLKRRLNRAITELERVGFLEPLSREARYTKVCRGRWDVVFLRKVGNNTRGPQKRASTPLEAALVKRGIWEHVAARLVRDHPGSSIRVIIREFDQLMENRPDSTLENPPGFLVAWIRERGDSSSVQGQQREAVLTRTVTEQERSRSMSSREVDKAKQTKAETDRVHAFLDKLTSNEFKSLEIEALSEANPFHAKCYRRSHAQGNAQLVREYRDMIIEAHVRRVIGLPEE